VTAENSPASQLGAYGGLAGRTLNASRSRAARGGLIMPHRTLTEKEKNPPAAVCVLIIETKRAVGVGQKFLYAARQECLPTAARADHINDFHGYRVCRQFSRRSGEGARSRRGCCTPSLDPSKKSARSKAGFSSCPEFRRGSRQSFLPLSIAAWDAGFEVPEFRDAGLRQSVSIWPLRACTLRG